MLEYDVARKTNHTRWQGLHFVLR